MDKQAQQAQPEVPDYLAQRGWLAVQEIPAPRVLSARLAQQVQQVQQAYKVQRAQVVQLALQDRPELDRRVVQARRVQRELRELADKRF
jgi:hypothetical protein